MNHRILFLTGITVVAVLLALSGCAGLEGLIAKPTARVASVEITGVDFESVSLQVNVEISNPNPVGLSLDAWDYGLKAWGASIAEGRQEEKVSLKANGKSMLPVPVVLDFDDLLSVGGSALTAETVPLDIALGLEIALPYMGTARLDLSASLEVPVPKAPVIMPTSLRVDSVGFSGAQLTLVVDVTNPNSFGMTLRSLEGAILVGGNPWGRAGINQSLDFSAGKKKTVEMHLAVDFGEVGRSAWNLLTGSGDMDVAVDGTMDVDMDIPGFNGSGLNWDADAKVSLIR